MCLLCIEWVKGSMSNQEAINAVGEMLESEKDSETRDHLFGLINRVMDKEDEARDSGLDTVYLDDLDEEDDECH
jgi:hypothetical protein